MIVTGGNTGVGMHTAKALLEHNAKVYIACRNQQKAEATITELHAITGKHASFLNLDLANLHSVREATEEFISKENRLDILFNNGGVMAPPMEQLSAGYDLQFHTNVLGHFYLTTLLLPTLLSTAKTNEDGKARVVNTASSAHYVARADSLNFDTFIDGSARWKYTTEDMYCQSKFANIVFSNELARRYGDHGIVSTSLNPGNLKTNLNGHVVDWPKKLFLALLQIYPADWGALTQLWAGTSPEGAELNGKFLIPWAREGKARKETEDVQLGRELWTWMEEQIAKLM